MNILHISTHDFGGAGLAALRLHRGLLTQGYDSRMLVLNKTSFDSRVYCFEKEKKKPFFPFSLLWPYIELTARKLGVPLSRVERYRKRINRLKQKKELCFTLPFSDIDLSCHPLVREADIVHLHWVNDFLDYPSFFKRVGKPIVWTVHDENLYMGGFHHRRLRDENLDVYGTLDEELATIKRQSVALCKDLTIISVSKTMLDLSLAQPIVRDRKHCLIHNSVDPDVFKPISKDVARDILSFPQGKRIVLFVSRWLSDPNKGFAVVTQAARRLNQQNIVLCVVGEANGVETPTGAGFYYAGAIDDPRLLAVAYSAADILAMPSFQEAFALAPLEAMACGVPVVAFPCSGTKELINDKNGICTADFTVESLTDGIQKALSINYDREWIRNDVIERFAIQRMVSQYVGIYRQVLK